MIPLLSGDVSEPRTMVWHFPHRDHPASAIIQDDWKLVRHILTGEVELFNLKDDSSELEDLSMEQPERTERLIKALDDHLRSSGAQRMRPNPEWDSAQPAGKIRNYGVFYPEGGNRYQPVKETHPSWFKSE